jgi:hypothetical protein
VTVVEFTMFLPVNPFREVRFFQRSPVSHEAVPTDDDCIAEKIGCDPFQEINTMKTFKKTFRRQDVRSELLSQGFCAAMVLVTVTVAFVMANLELNLHGAPYGVHAERAPVDIESGDDFKLP